MNTLLDAKLNVKPRATVAEKFVWDTRQQPDACGMAVALCVNTSRAMIII